MNKEKALIVGSTGNLGSAINQFLEKKFDLHYCYKVELKKLKNEENELFCSISKKKFDLSNYKVVINCSWVSGISLRSLNENIEISNLLLNNHSTGIYIYFSSIDVYGANLIDTFKCQPRTIFAIYKLKLELSILNKKTSRAKIILRVGNYISDVQLQSDIENIEFKKKLNLTKKSNLVSPSYLADCIFNFSLGKYEPNITLVENCVNEPNLVWDDVIINLNRIPKSTEIQSNVVVQNSRGFIPYFFKYLNLNGKVSTNVSFLKLKVFLMLILSRIIKQKKLINIKNKTELVSLNRVYQDYTL